MYGPSDVEDNFLSKVPSVAFILLVSGLFSLQKRHYQMEYIQNTHRCSVTGYGMQNVFLQESKRCQNDFLINLCFGA